MNEKLAEAAVEAPVLHRWFPSVPMDLSFRAGFAAGNLFTENSGDFTWNFNLYHLKKAFKPSIVGWFCNQKIHQQKMMVRKKTSTIQDMHFSRFRNPAFWCIKPSLRDHREALKLTNIDPENRPGQGNELSSRLVQAFILRARKMKGFRDSLRLWKISIPEQIPGFFLGHLEIGTTPPAAQEVSMYGIYTYMYACFLWYINSTSVSFYPYGSPVGWDSWGFACFFFCGKNDVSLNPLKTSGSDFKGFPCGICMASSRCQPAKFFQAYRLGSIAFLAPQKIRWDIFLRM